MKKKLLIMFFICTLMSAFSQIKVDAIGNLKIPTDKDLFFNDRWAIEYYGDGLNFWKPSGTTNSGNYKLFLKDATGNIGIGTGTPDYGMIDINANGLSSGVSIYKRGVSDATYRFALGEDNYGYLIRGATWTNGLLIKSNGYIGMGMVPSYKLDVNGLVRAHNIAVSSDKRLKKNIKDLENYGEKLKMLRAVEYTMNKLSFSKDSTNKKAQFRITDTTDTRLHYGFIAQEMKEVFPELVYEDENGLLSIDYISIIPLLLDAYKKQQEEIDNLKKKYNSNSTLKSSTTTTNEIENSDVPTLAQNKPNPFSKDTKIEMYIPEHITTAKLYIYDLSGVQKKVIEITDRYDVFVTISANELLPAMYIYSLITDGTLVGSKQMVIIE